MKKIVKSIKTPFLVTIVFMVICGLFYPLAMTGLGQVLFPHQANGSQVTLNGKVIGSSLIGQAFTDAKFLKGRPSAVNYNTYTESEKKEGIYKGVASGSQNFAPSNPKLQDRIAKDMTVFLAEHPTVKKAQIPTDLLTSSASGLDPGISVESALIQLPEMSKATGLSEDKLIQIVHQNTQKPLLGFLGEQTVNVFAVNVDIARLIGMVNQGQ